jgi:hypothetical protein
MCSQENGSFASCDAGSSNVPAIPAGTAADPLPKFVTGITSITDGVITATLEAKTSANADATLVLTPTVGTSGANVTWTASGTACSDSRGLLKC